MGTKSSLGRAICASALCHATSTVLWEAVAISWPYFSDTLVCQELSTWLSQAWLGSVLKTWLGNVEFVFFIIFSIMCDTVLDTEPDSDYSESVFVDNLQIIDPAFLQSKLGDTCTGVPGRLLGKSQFYIEVHASQYIIDTVAEGYKILFIAGTPHLKFFFTKTTINRLYLKLTLYMQNL